MDENADTRAVKVGCPFEIEDKMVLSRFYCIVNIFIQFFCVRLRIDVADDMNHFKRPFILNFVMHRNVLSKTGFIPTELETYE